MKFIIDNWYLIFVALASGGILLWPVLKNASGGSLTPARFKASDAEFNVGFAVAAAFTWSELKPYMVQPFPLQPPDAVFERGYEDFAGRLSALGGAVERS